MVPLRIAGGEVILLVEQRVIGDVHLPVHAEQRPVGVDDRGRVPVDAGGLALEERDDDDDAELSRELLHRAHGRSGDRLREVEPLALLRFAEVRGVEQLLEADDSRPARRGLADALGCTREIRLEIVAHPLLYETDGEWFVRHRREVEVDGRESSRNRAASGR
jgi:hypothetical protein